MNDINLIKKSIFFLSFPLVFIGFIFPIKSIEYGASSFQLGIIFATLSLVSILVKPIIGNFVDRKGYKTSLITGSIIYIVSLILLHMCNNYTELLLSSIVSGFAASFIWISCDAFVIANSNENEISENSAKVQQWSARGGFLGVLIGFNIMFNKDINDVVPVFLSFIVFMIISIYFTCKNLPEYTPVEVENKEDFKSKVSLSKKFTFSKAIKVFLVIVFISAIDGGLLGPVFLTYFKENITDNLYSVSYLYIPGAILSMILPVYLGKLVDKHNKMNVISIILVLNLLCWLYFTRTKDFNVLLVIFTLMNLFGTTMGLAWNYIKKSIFGNDRVGYKAGLATFASGLGAAIGALIGGWLYNYSGIQLVIGLKIVLTIVIFILCFVFFKKELSYKCSQEKSYSLE